MAAVHPPVVLSPKVWWVFIPWVQLGLGAGGKAPRLGWEGGGGIISTVMVR